MKILIIGASGMVGHILMHKLRSVNIDITGIARRTIYNDIIHIDITDWETVKQFLLKNYFDVIVNCAGTLAEESNIHKLQAVYINSLFPHLLVDLFKNSKTKIVHLSTGGVFSGNDEYYFEDSSVSPSTYYGITKAAGEFNNGKDLVIRSDFWGPDNNQNGTGIFNWFVNQQKEIKAYECVYFNGISNIEFARIALELINYSGIINLGTREPISKGDLLRKIKNAFNLNNIKLIPDRNIFRKIYLRSRTHLPQISEYDEMVKDVYEYVFNNKQFYVDSCPQIYP
jgi:dTDP-4-dehydrorhamnose reductase